MFHGSTSIVVIAVVPTARFGLGRGLKAVRVPRRERATDDTTAPRPGATARSGSSCTRPATTCGRWHETRRPARRP
jgi:hypothetical protein